MCAKLDWSKHARGTEWTTFYYKTRQRNRTERLRNVAEETSIWPQATRPERELTRNEKKSRATCPGRIQYWRVCCESQEMEKGRRRRRCANAREMKIIAIISRGRMKILLLDSYLISLAHSKAPIAVSAHFCSKRDVVCAYSFTCYHIFVFARH